MAGTAKILITGVAGFIGSNLTDRLLADGHDVVGVDNLAMGRLANIAHHLNNSRFRFLQRDVTQRSAFDDADLVDVIVHLAAFKIPRYGKTIDTLRTNYEGTTSVLELARRVGAKVVLASTSDVYGRNPNLPFSEEHSDCVIGSSKSPRWAYAVSKLFDEHLALAYSDSYGFPVTLLRFFGSYGPRHHLNWWGGPPPVFISCVLEGKPIPIHGDGSQTRTFTYVDDTVDGIVAAALSPRADGEMINIGGRQEVSILELARMIKTLSETPGELDVQFVPYESFTGKRYEDVMRRVPDTSLCGRLLGVRAKVGLEEGLRRTIAWQREATSAQVPMGGSR